MASDVGSGALMENAGAISAEYNVRINLKSINDKKFSSDTNKKLDTLMLECEQILEYVTRNVEKCL